MRAWYGIVLAGILFWLAACGANTPPSTDMSALTATSSSLPRVVQAPLAAETPNVLSPTAPTIRTPEALPPLSVTPDVSQTLELYLWVPEEFAPGAERGGDVLEKQIAEFQTAHPNVKINYVLKAPYGKGGIVDWLSQLNELMPERLPDAAIVDSRELAQLEKLGLLQPLQRALPSGAYWDLFASAQRIARHSGVWNNQPLTLETEHLVYDARKISSPPLTWQAVLTSTTPFAFAADSSETFLLHYLENGGTLAPREHPAFDASVMQAILDYYQRARANGNLNESTAVLKSAREVMPLFVTNQTPMAQVRARDFLIERNRLPNALAASIPTRDGRASALVSSWSFVMLTKDAQKQNAAMQYLAWLNDAAHLSEWSNAARMLPASKGAFAQAMSSPDYAALMWNLLDGALVAPSFSEQAPYLDAWHEAVSAVLKGQLSPDDAAFRAAQTISQ